MDKKNTFLGILFIVAGLGFMFWQAREHEAERRRQLLESPSPAITGEAGDSTPASPAVEPGRADAPSGNTGAGLDLLVSDLDAVADQTDAEVSVGEEIVVLSNDFIEVEFTNRGGAIRTVAFKKTKRGGRDDYVFNQGGKLPALSMSLAGKGGIREFAPVYEVETKNANSITFTLDAGDGLLIRRTYTIAQNDNGHDPYIIRHETTFENGAENPKSLATVFLNLGTAMPISSDKRGMYLNVGHYNGDKADFVGIGKLRGGKGFFGIGASAPREQITVDDRIEWASVKNQFFAGVLSSETTARELVIYPVEPDATTDISSLKTGITGSAGYIVGTVGPQESRSLDFEFYVGPKEFIRLQSLGNEQDLVMQFGFFGFFSKLLLSFMHGIHKVVPSWGWSIVIMTVIIKLLFWPLTAKASRSQKRMAKIQKPMAELKEKYKDNPQKMQQETMKLFKEHQVNPVAGCLPMLIQMPIFLGLFYMLRTASELRFAPFLWISDLSQPDTVAMIAGFPLNILPLFMGISMFFQMRMVPMSPTADPTQQKIFKFLPFVFLIFLYNFSSGLVLYWTVQNLLTILQTKITNSRPDEEPVPAAAAATPARTGKGGSPRAKPRKRKG